MDLDKLTTSIRAHEGIRLLPYTDTTGNLTIGYGHNLTSRGVSQRIADELLAEDIQEAVAACEKHGLYDVSGTPLDDVRRRVITELCFNLGMSKLLQFHNMWLHIRRKEFPAAANDLRHSLYAKQVGRRADVLATMLETGVDPA